MIEIKSTGGDPRYQGDHLAVEVTHVFTMEQLRTLIALAAARYGEDFVTKAAGIEKAGKADRLYMVHVPGTRGPAHYHQSLASAEAEATRLLTVEVSAPAAANVLQVVKQLRSRHKVTVEVQ